MMPTQTHCRPRGLLEPDAWKSGTSGSEGAGAQQCAPATRRFRIQRRHKQGTTKKYVYTYPSKKALASITAKVRALTNRSRHKTLTDLLRQLNSALRGWCNYFRHGVSAATFRYLDMFTWRRVTGWLRKRHAGINWKTLYRRFLTARPGHRPAEGKVVLFMCQKVEVTRYRWRADNIPTPWSNLTAATA